MTLEVALDYDAARVRGIIAKRGLEDDSSIWERLKARFASNSEVVLVNDTMDMPWPEVLGVIREFGSASTQKALGFRFVPSERARAKVATFIAETKKARAARDSLVLDIAEENIQPRLDALGFSRKLRDFQVRDLAKLLSLPHGANFSVPGAGKTTVTFALSLLAAKPDSHLFVVAPKAAFPAWRGIVSECIGENAPASTKEEFTVLAGSEGQNELLLRSGSRRFIMSYDLLVRQQSLIASYFSRQPVHLILDESHRMKAGQGSQRGAFLINIASTPIRRDILSGTPMPQGAIDMA